MADLNLDCEINHFAFSNYSMEEELYYHRIFIRPHREIILPRVDDPKVQYGALVIFVQEAIDFAMSTFFKISEWPDPFNIVQLRIDFPDDIYFNSMIGRAMCHFCTVQDSFAFVREGGFKVSDWMAQTPFQAIEYAAKFLEIIRQRTRPVNISIIYMLSFASHLVFAAVKFDKPELIGPACRSTVYMFQHVFPYKWIYWNTRLWSLTYNAVHKDLHRAWIPDGRFDDNLA